MKRQQLSPVTPDALQDAADTQAALVRAWPEIDSRHRVRVVETHISYVLLSGSHAYKIKKPVNLGFLDFSSLEKRRQCCEEEIRLNRRLAPALYLEVLPIRGTPSAPSLAGEGEILEYAVKMRRFPQSALLDRRLARNEVAPGVIDALADQIAAFHGRAERCPTGAAYGSPDVVWEAVAENFRQLRHLLAAEKHATHLDCLELWSKSRKTGLQEMISARQHSGWVRECHGDLHLGNVALVKGQPLIFDGIEFNPDLRWIDVVSEVAFMFMDLVERGRPDYGYRFLNRYLECTGDYAGLVLLDFYQVYRALVRAKVAAIRAGQKEGSKAKQRELAVCDHYLAYASRVVLPRKRHLTLLHGLSGAGKSWCSQILLEALGALRLRSDVERKRLAGVGLLADSQSVVGGGIYGDQMTAATYARLAELARTVLAAGYPVVVDAASLKVWQREIFRKLAEELAVPFLLLACQAPEPVLRRRLEARALAGNDVSEADSAILEQQIRLIEPLSSTERAGCLMVDTESCSRDELLRRIETALS